jgi:SSS family solute:Na+ symporter
MNELGAEAIVSLLTDAPSYDKIQGLTYGTTVTEDRENSRASWNYRDLIPSAVIVLITLATLLYFSPLGIG